jgi:hypothetical protein
MNAKLKEENKMMKVYIKYMLLNVIFQGSRMKFLAYTAKSPILVSRKKIISRTIFLKIRNLLLGRIARKKFQVRK